MNMFHFSVHESIILLTFVLKVISIKNVQVQFDGRRTKCSTSEMFPIAFTNISFQQFIDYHRNDGTNDEDFGRCNLGDEELCDSWWLVRSWTIENSIKRHYKELITDIRWQEFEPLSLKNDRNVFQQLLKLQDKIFYVPISWRVTGNLDLYFCTDRIVQNSQCYWLEILNLEGIIKFRRCLATTLPRKTGEIPFGMCKEVLKTVNIKTDFYVNKWMGFMLMKTRTEFALYHVATKTGNPKLLFEYPTSSEFLNIKYIFGRSLNEESFAKIHNYNFLQTTKIDFHQIGRPFKMKFHGWICISLFVAMCRTCRMKFMMGGHVLADISFSEKGTWRRIKLYIENSGNTYEQLYIETIGNELYTANNYWAIDFVQLCERNHFIFLPGSKGHTCEYVQPTDGYSSIEFRTDLSKIPLGFSSNDSDISSFQITSKTKTEVTFRCQVSKNISKLNWSLHCEDSSNLMKLDDGGTYDLKTCALWPHFQCGSFPIKGKDVNCTLKIVRTGASIEETIYFTNSEEAALQPMNIRDSYDSYDDIIHIGCDHPINSNGMLKGFYVTYTEAKNSQKKLRKNQMTQMFIDGKDSNESNYNITIRSSMYVPCTPYFIQVRAINNYGPGFASTKVEYSPPSLPNYYTIKKINEASTSVDFSIRTVSNKYLTDASHDTFNYILVLLTGSKGKCRVPEFLNTKDMSLISVSHVAKEFDLIKLEHNITVTFTIGDGSTGTSKLLNCKLQNEALETNAAYEVVFLAVTKCANKVKYSTYKFNVITGRTVKSNIDISIVFYIILSIIWFLVGLGAAISYNRCRRHKRPKMAFEMTRRPTTVDNIYSLSNNSSTLPKIPEEDKDEELFDSQTNIFTSFSPPSEGKRELNKPVRIAEFEKYLKNAVSNKLHEQFMDLPKGLTKPCEIGKLESNKPKNRFHNIIPYDENRVILRRSTPNENADYINASFINGFKEEKKYIATQGPKSLTINDFWQMVWQENVRSIIMLVNLEESGQKKVEKYWPNYNEDFQFGNIHVFSHSVETMPNFEIKVFRLVCEGMQRKIFHYHFLSWPDRGTPLHFHTLVPFIRKTLEISSKSPIVVHCCSGTAATAVFILCDICLRTARETRIVDILKTAYELRNQRTNMIDNILQYKLAHLVILEALTGLQSVISCNDDIDKFTVKLTGPEELMLQMQYLEDTIWQSKVLAVPPELKYAYGVFPKKNKTTKIVPDSSEAIELRRYPPSDKSSGYINAVKVDGYNKSEKYIVTQQPMSNTLNDFWRMIVQQNIETIISLNEVDLTDENSCSFWPTESSPQMSPVDFIILNYLSRVQYDNLETIDVHVLVEGKELQTKYMKVKIISLRGWMANIVLPSDLHSFLKFHAYADAISKQHPQCAVTCYDGNLASGLFVATSYMLEKIKLEKCYDVCEAVKIIRKNRRQFITENVQLAFLYEIAAMYIKGFQTYANFSTQSNTFINIYDYIE